MISKTHENVVGDYLYRLSHPLGEFVLQQGKCCSVPVSTVQFDYTNHPTKLSVIKTLSGKKGWLHLQRLAIDSFDEEEYLLFSAFDDDGNHIN